MDSHVRSSAAVPIENAEHIDLGIDSVRSAAGVPILAPERVAVVPIEDEVDESLLKVME